MSMTKRKKMTQSSMTVSRSYSLQTTVDRKLIKMKRAKVISAITIWQPR